MEGAGDSCAYTRFDFIFWKHILQ